MTPQVIWTRAAAALSHDVSMMGARVSDVFFLPCIQQEFVAAAWPSLEGAAICFTSQTAVAAIPHEKLASLQQSDIYTFGKKTAAALVARGLKPKFLDAADGQSFAKSLLHTLVPHQKVIVCCAETPAYDVTGALRAHGFEAQQLTLYRSLEGAFDREGRPLGEGEKKQLAQTLAGVICFASPSAVRGFCEVGGMDPSVYTRLHAVAIGETTKKAVLQYFKHCDVVASPDLGELFSKAFSCLEGL